MRAYDIIKKKLKGIEDIDLEESNNVLGTGENANTSFDFDDEE